MWEAPPAADTMARFPLQNQETNEMTHPLPTDSSVPSRLSRVSHDLRNTATVLTGLHEEMLGHADEVPDLTDLASLLRQTLVRIQGLGTELSDIRNEL